METMVDDENRYKNKRLSIRMTKQRKGRWREFYEAEGEWRSMSAMVIDIIEDEIARRDDDLPSPRGGGVAAQPVDVDMGPVRDDLDAIKGQLDTLATDMDSVRTNTALTLDLYDDLAEGAVDLSADLYELLPTVDSDSEMSQKLAQIDLDQFDDGDLARASKYGCEADIRANFSAYGSDDVDRAVDALMNNSSAKIHQLTRGGHRFIYEIEEDGDE